MVQCNTPSLNQHQAIIHVVSDLDTLPALLCRSLGRNCLRKPPCGKLEVRQHSLCTSTFNSAVKKLLNMATEALLYSALDMKTCET